MRTVTLTLALLVVATLAWATIRAFDHGLGEIQRGPDHPVTIHTPERVTP